MRLMNLYFIEEPPRQFLTLFVPCLAKGYFLFIKRVPIYVNPFLKSFWYRTEIYYLRDYLPKEGLSFPGTISIGCGRTPLESPQVL